MIKSNNYKGDDNNNNNDTYYFHLQEAQKQMRGHEVQDLH